MPRDYFLRPAKVIEKDYFTILSFYQAKLVVAGLLKVCKIEFSGLRMNVFPQFAGPLSKMLQYFP